MKKLFFILFQTCILNFTSENVTAQKTKPNIIFILTDDHRWDALGYAGNKYAHTPEMDKLAQQGVYFKNAHVTTPICTASRATILSGMQERAHRFDFRSGDIKEEFMHNSYPKILKENGYKTGFYGKFGVKYSKKTALFDEYEDYDRNDQLKDRRGYFYKTLGKDTVHLTRYTGQKAIDFLNKQDTSKPFCLSLSFSAPHAHDPAKEQYFWDEQTDHLLKDVTIPGPDLAESKYFDILPDIVKQGFNKLRWYWRYDTPEKYQQSMKGYYRMIAGVDLEIAKIRETLKINGLDKNTVIILMGDNGYFEGERQLAGKWLMYENSIRVPLIIYDPRVATHQDRDDLAANTDVPATILDLAGLKQPSTWHGQSLMPVVNDAQKIFSRDTALVEHLWDFENIPPSEGLRTKQWKYFRYVNDKSLEELYDLKNDPKEINNLVKNQAFAGKLKEFRNTLEHKIKLHADYTTALPSGLNVEFIEAPKNGKVTNRKPKFGWQVPSGADFQTAYQILLADSPEKLDQNLGNIRNSKKVVSAKSAKITLDGLELEPSKTYYWKVRLWDQLNRIGEYSLPKSFNMSQKSDRKEFKSTHVEIKGDQFYINGKPTYEGRYWQGHKIEGLLMNGRLVQGIFDDLNSEASPEFQYLDTKKWDAERNNLEFVAAMPEWKKHGLLAFTLNMQGGSPYGYGNKKCINPGVNADGSLMKPYIDRLDNILKKADELNMVVILGLFYFGQDQYLENEKAVINAVTNIRNWILKKGYKNVLIEIANECNHKDYDHAILGPDRISELINIVKSKKKKGFRLLAGTSFTGKKVPNDAVIAASDFVLIHGNGAKNPTEIQTLIDNTKASKAFRKMPVVNNEDDHFDFEKETNNMTLSVKNYVSWGYFDFRFKGETNINEGYQTVPVNWGISSERKKGFFNKLAEVTGVNPK